MAARQNYYVEENTRTTTSSTTFIDKITLTFTPDDNATYWFIWAANLDDDAGNPAELRFRDDTAGTDLALIRVGGTTADREFCWGGVYAKTYGASPGSQSFKLQFRHPFGDTAGCFNARIIAVKATANDQSAASDGDTTTTSATLSDKTTLTFTPGTTGDYLIIASCERNVPSASDEFRNLLDIDGVEYCDGEDPVLGAANGEYFGYMAMKKISLDASSHTIKLRHSSPSGVSTVTTRNARILALRLSDFSNAYGNEQFTRQTMASTTYATALSNTFSAVTANYLTLACGIVDHSNFGLGRACFQQLLDNSASQIGYAQSFPRQTPVGNNGRLPIFFAKRQSLSAGVNTYLLQHKSETGATTTVGFDEMTLIAIQLTEDTGSLEPVGQIVM